MDFVQSKTVTLNPYNQNKLSAQMELVTTAPVSYTYTVKGKSSDVDFYYSSPELQTNFIINIIGLYPLYLNTVYVVLTDENGDQQVIEETISTLLQFYGVAPLIIDVDVYDEAIAEATINKGWLVTNNYDAYDKNGDLRMTGMYPWIYGNMKIHDNAVYSGSDLVGPALSGDYATKLHKLNLLGEIKQTYSSPDDNHGFHHDICWDNQGHLYILATIPEDATDDVKLEAILYKYDEVTGELLWQRDYSKEFMGSTVLANSAQNDVHLNTVEYIEKVGQLVISSRSTCTIIGVDPDSGDFLWTVDNAEFPLLAPDLNLTVVNPDNFTYGNGQHCTIPIEHPDFPQYTGENQFKLLVYNNNSCFKLSGEPNVRIMEDSKDLIVITGSKDATGIIYGVDLNTKTVEMLFEFQFDVRTEFTSNIFMANDYFVAYCASWANQFQIFDSGGNLGVRAGRADTVFGYRGRLMTYAELRSLI